MTKSTNEVNPTMTYEKKQIGAGFGVGGIVGAGITALLMHSCYGTKTVQQNTSDCKSTTPVINVYCDKSDKPDSRNGYDGNKNGPMYGGKTCLEGQSCFDSDLEKKLKACLDENAELRKRSKHCSKYTPTTPKECPPAPRCAPTPYFRRGE
ncbi:MAG: hypothetical protein AABX31_01325 [Nanoarchaeota archaeon]